MHSTPPCAVLAPAEAVSSVPRIRILPDEVKSRIAAGEVVERPASALKELVENALDAGAKSIHARLEGGGLEGLRVHDDGSGMTREDLELSVRRHATSKLNSADDLQALSTLGFRGEALPSIGSVSKLTLTSRSRNGGDDQAWKLTVDGGRALAAQPAAGDVGTTVEVRELFYNLPARRKFMKGAGSEASACADVFLRLALTRPDVTFNLHQGRHEILACPAWHGAGVGSDAEAAAPPFEAYAFRAMQALGREASSDLAPVVVLGSGKTNAPPRSPGAAPASEYRLFGLLSPPDRSRSNRSSIYLTVNGRPVKDRTLTTALLEAYRHLLPPRRFPAAVLFLECPGHDVDINVHPSKAEVRFRIPGLIFSLLHHAVREAFSLSSAAPGWSPPPTSQAAPQAQRPYSASQEPSVVQARFVFQPAEPAATIAPPAPCAAEAPAPFGHGTIPVPQRPQPPSTHPSVFRPLQSCIDYRVLGQARGMYLVVEDALGVKLIDQHALHERILFDALVERAQTARADAQGLLVPETLELTPVQAAAFAAEETRAALLDLGFAVDEFGPRALVVSAVPTCLKNSRASNFVKDILDAYAGDAGGSTRRVSRAVLREKAAYICSCKGAIKAGEVLNLPQMEALMVEFHSKVGQRHFTCPHGRPLAVELSWTEIERRVGR